MLGERMDTFFTVDALSAGYQSVDFVYARPWENYEN